MSAELERRINQAESNVRRLQSALDELQEENTNLKNQLAMQQEHMDLNGDAHVAFGIAIQDTRADLRTLGLQVLELAKLLEGKDDTPESE